MWNDSKRLRLSQVGSVVDNAVGCCENGSKAHKRLNRTLSNQTKRDRMQILKGIPFFRPQKLQKNKQMTLSAGWVFPATWDVWPEEQEKRTPLKICILSCFIWLKSLLLIVCVLLIFFQKAGSQFYFRFFFFLLWKWKTWLWNQPTVIIFSAFQSTIASCLFQSTKGT